MAAKLIKKTLLTNLLLTNLLVDHGILTYYKDRVEVIVC